jgi:flagellar biosynthesis protein FlhG
LIAVSGSKGGVGVTSVAVNVAVELARQSQRVLLVDANFSHPDAAMFCGVEIHQTVCDVIVGKRTIAEVLQRGPAGIQVLAGAWAHETPEESSARGIERLLQELARLGPRTDCVVVDCGSGMNPAIRRWWQAASAVVLVTTCESMSVMDAYAAIKMVAARDAIRPVWVVVNRHSAGETTDDVQQRIQRACQRFLNVSVQHGPAIPADVMVSQATDAAQPLVIRAPHSAAGRALACLTRQLALNLKLSD